LLFSLWLHSPSLSVALAVNALDPAMELLTLIDYVDLFPRPEGAAFAKLPESILTATDPEVMVLDFEDVVY
jgi:hypothetical protein